MRTKSHGACDVHVGVSNLRRRRLFLRMRQLIFVGFIIYFLYHVISKIRKQKRKYFKEFWNLLELCTVVMSVLTCAMYGAKILFGNTAMDILKESGSGT